MKALNSIFLGIFILFAAAAMPMSASAQQTDAYARWDRMGGGWSTGWIKQTPQQYGAHVYQCGHFHSACNCGAGKNTCGWYNNGARTYWWVEGCNKQPWVIACTVQAVKAQVPAQLSSAASACRSTCTYNYNRCMAAGAAFAHNCNVTYNRCMPGCGN